MRRDVCRDEFKFALTLIGALCIAGESDENDSEEEDGSSEEEDSEYRASSSGVNTTGELELSVAAVTSAALKSKKRKKHPDGQ